MVGGVTFLLSSRRASSPVRGRGVPTPIGAIRVWLRWKRRG